MNIFSKEKTLYFCITVAVICFAINFAFFLLSKSYSFMDFGYSIFMIIFLVEIGITYHKAQKEILKGLLTAIIAVNLMYSLSCIDFLIFTKKIKMINIYVDIIWVIIDVIIFITHMMINVSNNPSPKLIRFNQIFIMILNILSIICIINFIIYGDLYYILWSLPFIGMIFMFNTVICVEGRIEFYREQRVSKKQETL